MPKFSILIIEDEKNIQTFMRKILIRHDYRVLCADAGTEGLSLIRSQCPDLVLLDLGLPDMNGNQIIQDAAVIYKKNNDTAAHSLQHAKKYCIMIKDF